MSVRTCEICGKHTARYICQECGRQVCETCLEPHTWFCLDCYKRLKPRAPVIGVLSWSTPLKLFFLGFLFIFLGMIIITIATVFFGGPTDSGVFVWIPPLPPIGFGVGSCAFWAIILGAALTALSIALYIALRKKA